MSWPLKRDALVFLFARASHGLPRRDLYGLGIFSLGSWICDFALVFVLANARAELSPSFIVVILILRVAINLGLRKHSARLQLHSDQASRNLLYETVDRSDLGAPLKTADLCFLEERLPVMLSASMVSVTNFISAMGSLLVLIFGSLAGFGPGVLEFVFAIPVFVLLAFVLQRKIVKLSEILNNRGVELESMQNVMINDRVHFKCLGAYPGLRQLWRNRFNAFGRILLQRETLRFYYSAASESLLIFFVVALPFLVYRFSSIDLNSVVVVTLLALAQRLNAIIQTLNQSLSEVGEALSCAPLLYDLKSLLDKAGSPIAHSTNGTLAVSAQKLGFSFASTDQKPDAADFVFPPLELHKGEWLTLSGPNGSGKTTWLRLLSGGLQPSDGQVAAAKTILLGETTALFAGTWAENLSLGETYAQENLEKALNLCDLDKLKPVLQDQVPFPNVLSSGDQELFGLARALVRGPEVLFIDESLRHVDFNRIQRVILNLKHAISSTAFIWVDHSDRMKPHCHRSVALQSLR